MIFSTPVKVTKSDLPIYRVVIDPGHGGVSLPDKQKHGDRYDLISGKYISYFAEGAQRKNI
ncbi:MAG: N-acetylmuramoyl-L-alanine amidase, partial [Spirochaetota bacterium]